MRCSHADDACAHAETNSDAADNADDCGLLELFVINKKKLIQVFAMRLYLHY